MERLKELRLKRGLTQAEVARHLKVDRTTLTKYETGEREPDLKSLTILSDYFNVTTDYLLGKSEIPTLDPDVLLKQIEQLKAENEKKNKIIAIKDAENIAKEAENAALKAAILKEELKDEILSSNPLSKPTKPPSDIAQPQKKRRSA